MTKGNYDKVYKTLYQGGVPCAEDIIREKFSIVVLCAEEHQPTHLPDLLPTGISVMYVPFDDSIVYDLTDYELDSIMLAVAHVVTAIRWKKKVLVTCAMGWNRSGLVTALALQQLTGWDAEEIIQTIRTARGPFAMSNPLFRKILEEHCS